MDIEKSKQIVNLYVIEDTVSEKFGPVFESTNAASAVRSVQGMPITTPDDFILWYIGHVDDGKLSPSPKNIKLDWNLKTNKENK